MCFFRTLRSCLTGEIGLWSIELWNLVESVLAKWTARATERAMLHACNEKERITALQTSIGSNAFSLVVVCLRATFLVIL